MEILTFIAAVALICLVWHSIFGIGPCAWVDNYGWEAKKEEEYLDELGPVLIDNEVLKSTSNTRTAVAYNAAAYAKVREALEKEALAILQPKKNPIPRPQKDSNIEEEDTDPQHFIQHAEGVYVDDKVTRLVMNLPYNATSDLIASQAHRECCPPECKAWYTGYGKYTCQCGTISQTLNLISTAFKNKVPRKH